MKKISAFLIAAMLTSTAISVSAEVDLKVIVDATVVAADNVIKNDRTLVPLRAIMENAGAEVTWYGDTKKIDVKKGEEVITLQIDSNIMNTAEGDKILDVAPMIYNGDTTYLPIRAVCEEFGMSVEWDAGTRTVLVTSNDASPYVDRYYGITVEDYAAMQNMTNEDVAEALAVEYDTIKGMSLTQAENMIPVSEFFEQVGWSDVGEDGVEFGVAFTSDMTIGEFEAEMTLGNYFEYIGATELYPTVEDVLADFREYYSLGEEYTLDTKYKFVRTIIDIQDYTNDMYGEIVLEAETKLAELTEKKIGITITMEDGSVMKGELYPDLAPITVENFKNLANAGFYDGLIFHRVIDGFMIQGGGMDKDMKYKESDTIKGEFILNGVANGLLHEKGVISMARADEYDSASSEFFIMDETSPNLDGMYAAFGRITEGLDVVDKISQVEVSSNRYGMEAVPLEPVIIKSIVVE